MALQRRDRRPNGTAHAPTRSIRIEDSVWEAARRRANLEGQTMSRVVHQLVQSYAKGLATVSGKEAKK